MVVSKSSESISCLIIGRFFIGLNCGANCALVPMYLSEIAPVALRGTLGKCKIKIKYSTSHTHTHTHTYKLIFLNLFLPKLPSHHQGTLAQLGVTVGLLMSQILGLPYLLGTETTWPTLLALAYIPAVIQLISLPICPESPRYLLITKGKIDEAREGSSYKYSIIRMLEIKTNNIADVKSSHFSSQETQNVDQDR